MTDIELKKKKKIIPFSTLDDRDLNLSEFLVIYNKNMNFISTSTVSQEVYILRNAVAWSGFSRGRVFETRD